MCQWLGARLVWAMSNFIVFVCMAGTAIISLVSVREYSEGIQHVIGGSAAIRIASLIVFALLGFPLAVSIFSLQYYLICLHFCPQSMCLLVLIVCVLQITYSVPFSVTAELTADSGGGQGL